MKHRKLIAAGTVAFILWWMFRSRHGRPAEAPGIGPIVFPPIAFPEPRPQPVPSPLMPSPQPEPIFEPGIPPNVPVLMPPEPVPLLPEPGRGYGEPGIPPNLPPVLLPPEPWEGIPSDVPVRIPLEPGVHEPVEVWPRQPAPWEPGGSFDPFPGLPDWAPRFIPGIGPDIFPTPIPVPVPFPGAPTIPIPVGAGAVADPVGSLVYTAPDPALGNPEWSTSGDWW